MPKEPETDLYTLLGLYPDASDQQIQSAYREFSWRSEEGSDERDSVERAYETLISPRLRADYDRDSMKGVRLVAGYQIIEQVADGSMGRVYKVRDPLLGTFECIKHCFRLNAQREALFLREARTLSRLRFHLIPSFRRIQRLENGSLVMVMSWIEGETLDKLVKRLGRIHPESVCWMAERMLNTFWYLHDERTIHGNYKPKSLIVEERTHNVVTLDFGLATIGAEEKSIGYTNPFSAPEQVAGEALLPESDFFSLGCIMLYLLSGGDLDCVAARRIPEGTPELLSGFIRPLLFEALLDRPQSARELLPRLTKVREKLFGRDHTGVEQIRSAS